MLFLSRLSGRIIVVKFKMMQERGILSGQPGQERALFQWGFAGEHIFVLANTPEEAVESLAKEGWEPVDPLLPSGKEKWSIMLRRPGRNLSRQRNLQAQKLIGPHPALLAVFGECKGVQAGGGSWNTPLVSAKVVCREMPARTEHLL